MRCSNEIKKVSKNLTDEQILELQATLLDEIEAIQRAQPSMSKSEAARVASEQVKKNTREAILIAKRNATINLMRRNELLQAVEDFIAGSGKDNPHKALSTILVGSSERGFSSRASVDATAKSIRNEFVGTLVNDLDRTGYLELAQSGSIDREIARELWEMREGGSVGSSGSKEAVAIAKIIKGVQRETIDRMNGAGAWIKEEPGYIIRQSHNKEKLTKAGYEKWRDTILPELDIARMGREFDLSTPDNIEEFMQAAYKNMTLGREFKLKAGKSSNPLGFAFSGPGNMAKALSAERVFHFKDADGFMRYNEQFGNGRILDNVFASLGEAGSQIALMDRFGTNPEYMFNRIRQELANKYRENKKVHDALTGHTARDTLTWQFNEVAGKSRAVGSVTFAQVGSGIRAIQSMSKLGMATVSSFADVVSQAAELNYHGVNLLQGYGNMLRGLAHGRGKGEYLEMMRLIGVGMDGLRGEVFTRMHGADGVPGALTKGMDLFFKANGLTWWTDVHKTSVTHMLSTHLAGNRHLEFGALDARLQNVLTQYGIKDTDWNLIRNHGIGEVEGNQFVLVDRLSAIPTDDVKAAIAAQRGINVDKVPEHLIEKYRTDLETKVRTYLVDAADWALPTPGARENAAMMMGTTRGTVLGEAMRFIMQFKAYPVTYLTKSVERELIGRGGLKDGAMPMLHMVIGMTVFGYLSGAAKDILRGKAPRDPTSEDWAAVWGDALVTGGGMGIYGDLLFSETTKYGNGLVMTLFGPTAGSMELVAKTYQAVRNAAFGKEGATWGDAGEAAYKAGLQHVPFANLFYLRLGLDYSLLWNIQELLNPGSLGRMERRAAKENQTYWLPPTEALWQ